MATIKGQYNAAIRDGLLSADITEEQFVGILQDPNTRKAYYDNSNKIIPNAYGDYDTFSKGVDSVLATYRQPQSPATAEPVATAPQVPTMPVGAAADSTDAAVAMLMDSNRKQQEQDKKERARINNAQLPMSDEDNQREERIRTIDNTLKQVGVERFANRQPIGDAREDVLQQQQQLEQERTALQGQRKSYMKEPETIEEARENWTTAWMENTEEGKQAKREADEGYQQAVDYLRNEFVKSKTHQDIVADVQRKYSSGALTEDEANAELNKRLNDAFIAENKETLEAEYKTLYGGLAERAYKADNGWLKKQQERIGTIAVQEAIDEGVDELNEAMRADYEAFSKTVGNGFGAAQAKSNYINTQQAGILGAASQLYQETETILESTVKGEEKFGTLTSEILRHSKDKLANLASFGMSDVNYSAYQAKVLKKIANAGAYDNPESVLDRNEQVLYNAIVSNVAAQLLRAENTSHLANAGKLTADMLPFVRDIIMGKGLLGGFSAAAEKGIMRGIVRSIGTGKWGKLLANLGKTGVGLVESTAISLISPSTYQQVFKEEAQIDPTSLHLTDEGWKVDKIDTKHAIDAFAAAHMGMTKELFTETGGMTQFAIRLAQASPLGKYLRKTKIGQIAQMFDNTIAGKLFNQTAYHGFAAELSEEWENTFYDAVLAAMNKDNAGKRMEAFGKVYGEFVKPETQVPMLISFALPAIFGGAVSTGQIITINSQYKQAYENLRNTYMKYGATDEEFEDALNELRAARMNMNVEDYPQLISGLAATLSGGSQEQADEFAAALSAYTVADANLGAIQEKHAKKQRQVQQLIRDIQTSEERITSNTHADSGMMYHVNVNGQPGYVVSGALELNTYDNAELPVAVNSDIVTVRMEDGSVKQIAANQLQLLEQPQSAEGAMEFERRRLTARMNNLDRFKVGDVIYMTENGQPIDGNSSRVVDVTDEGVVAEIIDPNGQPNTTVIPHEVAESGLSTSDELVEDGVESVVLEMNNGSLITMQKTTSGDWMQVAPKDDSMTLWSQEDLDEFIANGGAKIVNGDQAPSLEVASGNGVVSEETGEIEQPTEQPQAEQPAKPYATDEQGNPAWAELDVEQSVGALLSEMEDDKELSKQFAQSQIAAAKSALNKANKRKPQATTDLAAFRAEAQAIKQEQQAAQAELSKWENILLGIANYKTADEQAAAEEQAAQAAAVRAQRKQTIEGVGGTNMAERLAASPRIDGNAGSITAADGTKIPGHYVLVSANALTPSHNPNDNFAPSEGYPTVDGQSINDRDYQADQEEQAKVQQVAHTYDGRAITNMPIVSDEGLVYSGNGRTMAGQLAAANGTDGAYTEALMENATQFGFTAEQVESVPNARVVFMTDERLPYNTTTLALFNQNEQQTQSNTASAAANVRKLTPEAVGHIIAAVQEFDTVDAFFGDSRAPFELVNRLIADGIISERDKAAFVDNGRLTATGKDRLTALLFGTAFDEKTIRLLGDNAKVRNSVMRALPQILENKGLGDFSLFEHINNAIQAIYDMDTNKMSFFEFTRQIDIEGKTASDKYTAFELLLVDSMTNGGVQAFRDVLSGYNARAKESAGGQMDLFTGEVLTTEELTKQILQEYEQREANERGGAQPEPAAAGTSESDGEKIDTQSVEQIKLIDGRVVTLSTITDKDFALLGDITPIQRSLIAVKANAVQNPDLKLKTAGYCNTTRRLLFYELPSEKKDLPTLRDIYFRTQQEYVNTPNKTQEYRFAADEVLKEIRRRLSYVDPENYPPKQGSAIVSRLNDAELAVAEAETDTNPTEAQKKAENYKQGHVTLWGLPFTIENPKGSVRRGTDGNGKQWEQVMNNTYGKIRKTEGVDGDHIDVFFGPNLHSDKVFVVDQLNVDTKEFDEHKVMLGFDSMEEAQTAYLSNYEQGWQGMGPVTETTMDEFKKWIESSHRKTKPFIEYKSVKQEGAASSVTNRETTDRTPRDSAETTPVQKSVSSGKKASNKTEKTQGSVQNSAQLEQKNAKSNEKTQDVGKNTVFTDEMLEAARQRMRSRMNRLNAGIDPEMLADGIVFAGYYVEKGVRKFADFAKNMIAEFGESIRPYLKAFYNGLRDMPEAQAFVSEMDDYASVAAIDVNTITLDEQVQPSANEVQTSANEVQPSTEQVQPKQVSVEGLFNDLNRRGTAKLSDNVIGEEPAYIKNYREIKEQYPDALVLFRAGDFYEVYLEDAQEASKILGITLTKTGNYPLAGFPFHALDSYLPKLVRAGKRVAIAEKVNNKPKVVETVENQPNLAQNLQESEKNSNFAENIENNEQDNKNLREGVEQTNAESSEIRGGSRGESEENAREANDEGGNGRVRSLAQTLNNIGDKQAQEEYLTESYLWNDYDSVISQTERELSKGKESEVYFSNDGKSVIKLVDYSVYSQSPADFLRDRVELFNELFPQTAYTIIGVTERNGKLNFVLSQPFIKGKPLEVAWWKAGIEEYNSYKPRLDELMREKFGMENYGLDAYQNDMIRVQDLHYNNIIEGEDGQWYVVDAITSYRDDVPGKQETPEANEPQIITDAVGEIKKSTDTRDGSDIWLVNPTDRVSKEEFAELKKRAKAHNGYYSNFKQNRGFLFRTEEDAIAFNRINENELTTDEVLADTGLVIGEAETRRNEAETIAESTRVEPSAPTTGEAIEQVEQAEQEINKAIDKVDQATEQVNDQLMLLGYYKSESDSNEWGLSKKAEKAALKDVNKVANQLAKDLGVEGKIKASANIAPAGGDITFRIPLQEGKELYVCIPIVINGYGEYYNVNGDYADLYIPESGRQNSLVSSYILYRVETPSEHKYGTNYYADTRTTYDNFLLDVRYIAKEYLPERAAQAQKQVAEQEPSQELQTPLEKAKARQAKQKKAEAQQPAMGDLFAGTLFAVNEIEESINQQNTQNNENEQQPTRRIGSSEPTTGNVRSSDRQQSAGVRSEVTIQEDTRPTDGGGTTAVLRDEREESRGGLPLHAIEQEPLPDNQKKNKRNNNVKRGVDYAPKTAKERFEANIAAIQQLKELEESGKQATPAQMKVLRKFTGWGGLGEFFKETYWAGSDTDKLKTLLTPEEYDAANLSRNSAYFTPGAVIDRLWDIAAKFGFQGGNITEGSAGTGEILARIPQAMNERSEILAVEIDPITGGILKQLYPDARVEIDGFQNVSIPNGSQDLVITNVPFVRDLRVFDKEESDLSKRFTQIQDFCIAKNIRKLREGGLGIFIAGKSSLDSSKDLRKWIVKEGNCDVVGAFRLNKDTFNGTSATADIIVVKKRVNGVVSPNAIDILDVETVKVDEIEVDTTFNKKTNTWEPVTKRVALAYNKHYVQHPEDMGGEMALGKDEGDTRFGGGSSACYPRRNINQMQRLDEWIANMGKGESMMPAPVVPAELKDYELAKASQQGQIVLNSKGEICIADRGKAVPMQLNSNKVKGQSKEQVVKDYIALKEAVNKTLYVQLTSDNEADLQAARKALNTQYDSFVKKYGYLNKNTALSFLRNDVEYPSIAAIEKYEEIETPKGKEVKVEKTDIFKKRVIGVKSEPTPTNTRDAVVLSVQQFGRLDLAQMAQWLNMSEEAVREDIVKERLGFVNPETQQLQIRHEYLSGNVRQKLAYAQAHNENGEYTTNIEELQKVIPMDIPAHLIEFSLGSTWIDPKMYEDFVREKYDVSIKYSHIGGVWSENGSPYLAKEKNRAAGVHSDLLNMHVFGNELFLSAMNNVPYIVSKKETYEEAGQKKTRTITDKAASQACATRIDEIRDEFTEWARQHMQQDAELAQRMERVYNDKFNAIVPMDIDEQFTQAFLPGMNPNTFPLYPIQQKAIVRGTMQPVLLAHEVGTGKTRSLICTAMEMRRLGTAKKPLIVVQNATVMQFVNEAKELFPNAKVLTVNEKDRTSEGRREFYAKIKYNDWDMVIIPQSVFEKIPDSDERKRDFIQEKVDEKLHVLEQAREADMDSRQVKKLEGELESLREDLLDLNLAGKKQSKKDSKKEQVRKETAEARAEEMLARKTDDVADFDQMGIDALLVDEVHNYKHLGFATMMQRGVKGIDPSYAKKSAGLYLKVQSVFEQSGGKNVVFATGTPISNTAAEIWTFMKYLMPKEVMQENDIYYFDDFVRNFGKISQSLEFATNGKFKENTRFASYVNIPELARIWGQITDTRLSDEVKTNTGKTLKEEKIPTIEGGKQTDIFLEQSDSLVDIMNAVRSQLEEYENMSGAEKKEHSYIPLTMYGIAKRAAIDPRLVDATAKDEPESKTNKAVEETLRALKDSKKYNGTVAIFCDSYRRMDSVNGKRVEGFNIFEDIRNKLIKRGVPADQIVIMKSDMTDKAKQQVFDAMNAGSKRVILGSTQTLGTGVNIQTRLFTLIHMDAPDRPMDMTQREGRILRQGNMHKQMGIPVRILRFGVKDSLDVTGYQRLQTKSRFIDSIMRSKDTLKNNQEGRVIEEDEEGLYDNPVAVLSGSQYALLKSQAEREYRKLLSKQQQHNADQIYIENQLRNNALSNKRDEDYVADSRKRLAEVEKLFPNSKPKAIVVNGVKTTSNESLEKAVKEYNKTLYDQQKQFEGQYNYGEEKRDIKLTVSFDGTQFDITIELKKRSEFENGQRKVKMEKRVFYSCTPLNIEKTPADNTVSLQRVIEEIRDKELSGMYDRQRVEAAEQRIARRIADNEEMQKRRGKQFELTEELAAAKKRVDEYTELMRQELAEQEAKYANRGTGAAVDLDAARDTEDDSSEAEMMIVDSYDDAEAELTEAQQLIFDGLAEVAADAGIEVFEVSEEQAREVVENTSEEEMAEIKANAERNGTYLKAPNGANTNLTPRQWLQVRTKAFKKWFGDWENDPSNVSKIVDENGEPMVVYHGTDSAGFTTFERNGGDGIYFSDIDTASWYSNESNPRIYRGIPHFKSWSEVKEYADKYNIPFDKKGEDYIVDGVLIDNLSDARNIIVDYVTENNIEVGSIYACFINIRNPKYYNYEGHGALDNYRGKEEPSVYFERLMQQQYGKKTKYDGIVCNNIKDFGKFQGGLAELDENGELLHYYDNTVYIVSSSNQIKSATDNIGTFDENSGNIELFTNPITGKILGYAQGGTIYLTKAGITPETMVHEYTHVWAKAMQRNNRAGWENIIEIFKQSPLWEYVKNDPNYKDRLTTDDAICSEVLARFSSKQGAAQLDEVAREFIYEEQQKGGSLGAARVRQFINHARQAIKSFWKWVGKNLFGITKFDSMEDVADRVLYDLLNATKLDVDSNDKTVEASIERPSAEFVEAMRAWNAANPYPIYTEGESLGAFSDRLTAWKEACDAYRAELWRKSQEKIESADPITEPMVAGSKPVRKKDETPLEYAQRLKQWQNAQIDSQLSEEYTAEMNRLAGTVERAKRAFVDAALPIEEWQNWLIERGATMTSESNAYQDMFLAQGRVSNAAEELRRDIIQKLTRKIAAIIESKKLDDVDLRWHNMDVPGTKRTINGNKLSVRELIGVYCQAKDCEEAEEKGLPDRGKAGFKNNLDVEYTDIVNAVETRLSKEDITELWSLINQATKYALDYDLEAGRISQDTYDEFADREYYVPQRGWRERDESGLIEEYEPVGKRGHDPYNAALVKARGRQSLAADPFAYIMSIDHSSIVSSENNKIKQKMLQFCLDNEEIGLKTGAFRVKKYWLMHEIDPDTGKIRKDEDGTPITLMSYTEPKAEDFKHDKQVKDEVKRIEKEIAKRKKALEKELAEHGDTNYAKALQRAIANSEAKIEDLNDTLIIAFGATNTHISQRTRDEKLQHEVQVMKDGQRYVIELQDEKVANAINKKFKQHQEALFNVSDKMRNATRFMSAMLTQYNPEFAASNFVRDFQVAVMTLASENPKLLPAFLKNFAACQRAVMAYAFADKVQDRTKYVDSDMGRLLEEYMKSGAPTGFSYMQDLKTLRKDFDSMVNEGKLSRGVRSAAGIFSMFTEISETAVRFAAYAAARKAGWAINDAAYMSKELTTNFDRAGEMADSGWMSWFSFMRATINGNVKFFRAFKKLPIAYGITAAVYFAMGLINQFANPNDPEDEVWASDYVRENNFVIGKWRIPAAHFMRIFYSAGVNMASWMRGERTFGHAVYNSSMSAFNEILPNYMNIPGAFTEWSDKMERVKAKDPKAVIRELAPTPISPFVDVWANRNFMGGTINREPFVKTQENTKDILMAKDNTLPIYRAITEGIYTAVGGDLNSKYKSDDNAWTALFDVSGSSLEHITEGYLTGGMDMLATTANMIYDAVQGNELTPDKITFIRKFYNQYTPQRAYDQQYWLLKGRVQEYQRKLNDYEENNPDKYELETRSKQYKAYEETNELIWEKIENPTAEDVKQLMEANKQWTKASK